MHDVLANGLGTDWRDRFDHFDDRPAAAASIGQVHRAVWHDGTDVAVKIQYPGVAEALTADLGQLNRVAPLVGLGAPKLDPRALFEQLGDRFREELDYRHEADVQRAFATAFADDDDFVVPEVVAVADGVLVTQWVGGTPLIDVIRTGDATASDDAASRLLRLLLSSPARVGIIHGDPHAGNFRIQDDGRLAILDFGSSEPVAGWPGALGELLRAGATGMPKACTMWLFARACWHPMTQRRTTCSRCSILGSGRYEWNASISNGPGCNEKCACGRTLEVARLGFSARSASRRTTSSCNGSPSDCWAC